MSIKKICIIAQFPPPMHGLSKAVETIYKSKLADEFDLQKVDLTNNKKFLRNLISIGLSKVDLYYFTISQTKYGNMRDLIIFKLLRIQKKKCLIHLHGGYYRKLVDNDLPSWQRKLNYKAINRLECVIILSDSLKSNFQGMIPDEKIFVVPNCVDNQFLMTDEEFNEKVVLLEKKKVLHVLYLSNFIKEKGYPEVLEMARIEKERVVSGEEKRIHFNFAGKFFKDMDKDFFFNYIKKYGLEDFVTYYGIVGGLQKKNLLNKCDILMLLTRYPNEGQPISILEAMGNGMIIVATDHAGIPDLVKDNVNGIVWKEDSQCGINALYKKLIIFLNTNAVNIAIITNRKEVMALYQEESYLSNLRDLFLLNST